MAMGIVCPHCGHTNLGGADFCEECFQDLTHESLPKPTEGLQRQIMGEAVKRLKIDQPLGTSLDASVLDAAHLMQDHHIGCLLVLENQKVVGIFTERDLLNKVIGKYTDLKKIRVRDVMTANPVVLKEDDSIAFALNKMAVGGFRHIPVVVGGLPIGIISVRNVLQYLCGPETKKEKHKTKKD